jgi:hypothetical protein
LANVNQNRVATVSDIVLMNAQIAPVVTAAKPAFDAVPFNRPTPC